MSSVFEAMLTPLMTVRKTFTPIRNMLVVEIIQPPALLASGLAVPDMSTVVAPRAWVAAAGPECKQVKDGDQVIIVGGTESMLFTFNGVQYRMIQEAQCLGVVLPEHC